MTKGKNVNYTLVAAAKKVGITAKGARAKFRRMKKERPFDHTKTHDLTAVQFAAAQKFLKQDYRHA